MADAVVESELGCKGTQLVRVVGEEGTEGEALDVLRGRRVIGGERDDDNGHQTGIYFGSEHSIHARIETRMKNPKRGGEGLEDPDKVFGAEIPFKSRSWPRISVGLCTPLQA